MSRRGPAGGAALVAGLALLAGGCGGGAAGDGARDGERTLTVFAAASLATTFERLAAELERTHEGLDVELALGGSSDLVAQVRQGAPADVVATADERSMALLVDDGLVGEPALFAANTLRIAVPPGNPAGVASLEDLAGDLAVVVCAPEVPCGTAARAVAADAGVELSVVSEEQSVTDVLGKVRSGEADAGLVYVTDVVAAGDDVEGIAFPEADAVVNRYPVAAVRGSDEPALAQELVDLVLSPTGRRVLAEAGFAPPPAG